MEESSSYYYSETMWEYDVMLYSDPLCMNQFDAWYNEARPMDQCYDGQLYQCASNNTIQTYDYYGDVTCTTSSQSMLVRDGECVQYMNEGFYAKTKFHNNPCSGTHVAYQFSKLDKNA